MTDCKIEATAAGCTIEFAVPHYPLLILLLITLAATAMLLWNVHRASHQRRWLELNQWLRNNRMSLVDAPPLALTQLFPTVAWTRVLSDATRTLAAGHTAAGNLHLLLVHSTTNANFPPTALRPTSDTSPHPLFTTPDLRPYPTLPGAERFTTYGTTLHAARTLANSQIRGLLPPDLALLLTGPHLILDFSPRPFDPLEFSRLLPLAQQIRTHLPAT